MPAAYIVVSMNITNLDQYKQYMARAAEAVKAAGGEYLARGGKHETLEGDWKPHRLGVLRFPSYEAAKGWYDSQQYTQAKALREGTTEYFNMVLVEGVPAN